MTESLPAISLDPQANEACKNVNTEALKVKDMAHLDCSLRVAYKKVVGEDKTVDAEGNTFSHWKGTAQELILFSIVDGVENDKLHSTHPLLEKNTNLVGMSFMAHEKFENIFQVLYVKEKVNTLE